jgi:hypothetical protein
VRGQERGTEEEFKRGNCKSNCNCKCSRNLLIVLLFRNFAGVVVPVVLISGLQKEWYARSIASAKGKARATREGSQQLPSTAHDLPKYPRKVLRGCVGKISEQLVSRCQAALLVAHDPRGSSKELQDSSK